MSASLAQVLHARATATPDGIAYTCLADGDRDVASLTWRELDQRSQALAAALRARGAAGQPVLLPLPSSLAFVESLFAVWQAGAIAVPVSLPRHQRLKYRLDGIIRDSGASFAMGAPLDGAGDDSCMSRLHWIDPAAAAGASAPGSQQPAQCPPVAAEQVALLQYTSGSTGVPRGVIVTHANLVHNTTLIAQACGLKPGEVIAGWLPLYHDMGLIGLIIQAVTVGLRCIFMPPERFLMRPWLWLQMMSDYRACSSPAPNFAYDLCAEKLTAEHKARLDLSHWRNALNGSEPVRAATMERFASTFEPCGFKRSALFPCYGLAESTLFATGPGPERVIARRTAAGVRLRPDEPGGHVGCGKPYGDTRIAIVDPATCTEVAAGSIGEIWLAGASVAKGYWNQAEATLQTFGGRLAAGGAAAPADAAAWLRTGDLGFIAEGELFITGRLRELIIIAGRNHFPIDIERSIEAADPAIVSAIAFSVEVDGSERLIVAAEVRREFCSESAGHEPLRQRIRAAVVAAHEVVPHHVALLRPGAVPRTANGKVSRRTARDAYLNQTLRILERADAVGAT